MDPFPSIPDLVARAASSLRQGDLDAARNHAVRILQANPQYAEAHNLLAVICSRRNEAGAAIEHLKLARAEAPLSYAYTRNLVVLLARQGCLGEADAVVGDFVDKGAAGDQAAGLRGLLERERGLGQADHGAAFEEIYRSNAWGKGSGLGSLSEATASYRDYLQGFMAMNGVRSVADIGCGDWQFSRHIDWGGIDYLGIDVSATALHKARHHQRDNIVFRQMDVTREGVPPCDLVILKDVMQHWPNADITAFLPQLSSARWALITNRLIPGDPRVNTDITLGNVRSLDLSNAPFELAGGHIFRFVSNGAQYCPPIGVQS